MDQHETAIAVFPDHQAAENAVKSLTEAGFDMKNLSVIGKGYHSEEKVVGFYNMGDRVKFWGSRGQGNRAKKFWTNGLSAESVAIH